MTNFNRSLTAATPRRLEGTLRLTASDVTEPLNVGSENVTLCVKASAGIAIFPKNGVTVDTLVIGADLAMRQAKHSNCGYAFAR